MKSMDMTTYENYSKPPPRTSVAACRPSFYTVHQAQARHRLRTPWLSIRIRRFHPFCLLCISTPVTSAPLKWCVNVSSTLSVHGGQALSASSLSLIRWRH